MQCLPSEVLHGRATVLAAGADLLLLLLLLFLLLLL
jgi:hypothetical protein